ncbi:MAG: ribosome-binding factor A [Magnetococcales bacterium]|nr:ribosome-binding factor A [Magnetococcales bacterium]
MKQVTAHNTGSGGRIRTERVQGSIRQEIAEMLLRQEIHDPRLAGFISITDVRLSADLQHATVYFSVVEENMVELQPLGEGAVVAEPPAVAAGPTGRTESRAEICQRALTHAAGFIRSQLGRRIQLRHIPHLRFLPDHSLEYGMRMDRLLGSLDIPPAETDAASQPVAPTED